MSAEIARNWFVPGEGIDRGVISAHIQRFLGNDATVRPGRGGPENPGVDGYWIKAYRNLTSAMIVDLQRETQKWRQEQRANTERRGTGSHDSMLDSPPKRYPPDNNTDYTDSEAYHHLAGNDRPPPRRNGDSPLRPSPFAQPPPNQRERRIPDRPSVDSQMVIDPAIPGPPDPRYPPQNIRQYPPPPDNIPYLDRSFAPDGRPYAPDQVMQDSPYGRPPVVQDPRYSTGYPQHPGDGTHQGYSMQGNGYYPPGPPFDPGQNVMSSRSEPPQYGSGPYGGPPHPAPVRDPRESRDIRNEPRFGTNEYVSDPRHPYPSPATTVSSLSSREPIPSVSQPGYGAPPNQYNDPYGRPAQPNPGVAGAEPTFPTQQRETAFPNQQRDPSYARERPSTGLSDGRDARRRRVQ